MENKNDEIKKAEMELNTYLSSIKKNYKIRQKENMYINKIDKHIYHKKKLQRLKEKILKFVPAKDEIKTIPIEDIKEKLKIRIKEPSKIVGKKAKDFINNPKRIIGESFDKLVKLKEINIKKDKYVKILK